MKFTNPFNRIKTYDDWGYLRVNVSNFLQLANKPQPFYDAIKKLASMRDGFVALYQAGLLGGSSNGFNSYKMALDWLKLNSQITQGYTVSPITSYDDINDALATAFLQYTNWFEGSYINNDQSLNNAKLMLGIIKADKLKALDLQVSGYADDIQEEFSKVKESLDALEQNKTDAITQVFATLQDSNVQAITSSGKEAVANIEQAQALTIWHDAYRQNIEEYQTKLFGRPVNKIDIKGMLSNCKIMFSATKTSFADEKKKLKKVFISLRFLWYLFSRTIRFVFVAVWKLLSFIWAKASSLSGRRFLWFFVLGCMAVAQSVLLLIFIVNGHIPDYQLNFLGISGIENIINSDYIVAKIGIYIGFIAIPTIGYSFSNKNYRIYANLLDQYKHRATVAQTLQGILRNIDESESNKDIRVNLVSVAAVAMFEMKNVGHLTKRDSESSIVNEAAASLLGKNT